MRRRTFLKGTAGAALHLFVIGATNHSLAKSDLRTLKFGPLLDNGSGFLDVPKGFSYTVLQRSGSRMSDGNIMPHQPDGMSCFLDDVGNYVLLRNQELGDRQYVERYQPAQYPVPGGTQPKEAYNGKYYGGVSRVVVSPKQLAKDTQGQRGLDSTAVVSSNHVLLGTDRNCGGGNVAGGWATCEESSAPGHGYAFLTLPSDTSIVTPRRLDSWGRFHREAIATDPRSGVVYMTEDRSDGLFYRHVPKNPSHPTGPGRLEALRIKKLPHTDPYPFNTSGKTAERIWTTGQEWLADWVPIDDAHAKNETCRSQGTAKGATQFNRGEGVAWDGRSVWFSASTAGPAKAGQIFRYTPIEGQQSGTLTLEYEVTDRSMLSCPDNLVVAPWGDLVMAEDNYGAGSGAEFQYLRGLTPDGELYDIARNRQKINAKVPGAEFAGCCFSPDGKYLFVNLMFPQAATLAIRGPWPTMKG